MLQRTLARDMTRLAKSRAAQDLRTLVQLVALLLLAWAVVVGLLISL